MASYVMYVCSWRWVDVVRPRELRFDTVGLLFIYDKLETIDSLKDNIREVINEMQLNTVIDLKIESMGLRIGPCSSLASRGSHKNKIIFHY